MQTENPPSGNIFGWKISFISLGIILVTLIAVLIFDDPESFNAKRKGIVSDTMQIDSLPASQ